jgi:multiple sugar transport system ATP-binding protein
MAGITMDGVSKVFPDGTKAVCDLDLAVADGEFVVLVGPSGSGKSTALRIVAGLEDATSGTVRIGERDVTDVEPKDRDLAMVFQSYALYPHMSVEGNMGFALKMANVPRAQIAERVREVAGLLGIADLLGKRPSQLSGGQRQRVALGRAIVRQPQAFLMDEPLSNLDAKLRVEMRGYVARLHAELEITTLYVTHDQVEAMTMGDRVAVMRDGRIVQTGTPAAVYERPADLFVAGFMGSPPMNLVSGRVEAAGDGLALRLGSQTIALPPSALAAHAKLPAYAGRDVVVGIRPEELDISSNGSAAGRTLILPVLLTESLGAEQLVHLDLDAPAVTTSDMLTVSDDPVAADLGAAHVGAGHARVTARLGPHAPARAGQPLALTLDPEQLHFFDAETQLAIR